MIFFLFTRWNNQKRFIGIQFELDKDSKIVFCFEDSNTRKFSKNSLLQFEISKTLNYFFFFVPKSLSNSIETILALNVDAFFSFQKFHSIIVFRFSFWLFGWLIYSHRTSPLLTEFTSINVWNHTALIYRLMSILVVRSIQREIKHQKLYIAAYLYLREIVVV